MEPTNGDIWERANEGNGYCSVVLTAPDRGRLAGKFNIIDSPGSEISVVLSTAPENLALTGRDRYRSFRLCLTSTSVYWTDVSEKDGDRRLCGPSL